MANLSKRLVPIVQSLSHPSISRCYATASRKSKSKAESPSKYKGKYVDVNDLIALPPTAEWRKWFPVTNLNRTRVCVRNPDTADAIANSFVPEGSKDKVIIESYPGAGQLTRALLKLPKERIRKIIVMEDDPAFLEYLQPLEQYDSRVTVLPVGGYDWAGYRQLGPLLEDVPKLDWASGVHPTLQFMSHLALSGAGEQLIAQFFRAIPDRAWLFQFGRIQMNFLMSSYMRERILSGPDMSTRCKVGVIAQAVADISEPFSHEILQPFGEHFHPAPLRLPRGADPTVSGSSSQLDPRRMGTPFEAMTVIPKEKQVIEKGDLDAWDYCLRRLFVQKATPLEKSLPQLAPGAQSLVKKLTDPNLPERKKINIKATPRSLTTHEWSILLRAFLDWPFKPTDLAIDTLFLTKDK